jgi:fatty acid amide hydrolase 2
VNVLCTLSATRLARLIRSREVSSREVVEAHIARALEINPTINAIVRDRYDAARAEADAADQRLAREGDGGLPALHGVPCTIKENLGLTGMPHSSGLVARKDEIAPADGTAVARLRAAGAIPIGVTNISELCMWMETSNRIYGRTNNPYDPQRIVGGSSGGEGAIVASGASPLGLGADIGGSIRMPAFFCGVFGHKPSGGLVPSTGHYPEVENELQRYNCLGPLARRAEDLMPALRLIAGPDGHERLCRDDLVLGDPATVDLAGLRVVVIEENGVTPVSSELRTAQRRAADALRARGALVEVAAIDALRHSFEIWSAALDAARGKAFSELLGNGQPFRAGRELVRWGLRRSPHTLPAIALAALEKLPALLPSRARRALEIDRALREELTALVGDGVLLYPSYAEPAPRHYKPLWPPFN